MWAVSYTHLDVYKRQGVKGIFWDPGLRNGVGDISIKSMDLLMMYWEPGVMDIQDSPNPVSYTHLCCQQRAQ